MNTTGCERLRELGAELALGVLPARERAEALAHLDGCPACREYVEGLTRTGDALLAVLPGTEPPLGFETRALARLLPAGGPAGLDRTDRAGGRGRAGWRPRLRPRMAAAALALALACGFGGWAVGTAVEEAAAPPAHTRQGPTLLQAALRAGGHEVGRIFAYPGAPGWVYMSLDLEPGAAGGGVRCVLVRADGSAVPVGTFSLKDGYGSWGAPAPVDPSTLSGARVLAADGTVLAAARFTPSGR